MRGCQVLQRPQLLERLHHRDEDIEVERRDRGDDIHRAPCAGEMKDVEREQRDRQNEVDSTPVASAGVKAVMGNRKPVRLVNSVVARKIAVQPVCICPRSMPSSTTIPVAMPTRLMMT